MRSSRARLNAVLPHVEFALVVPYPHAPPLRHDHHGHGVLRPLSATNAVREGARYGAAADVSSTGWATSVRDRVKQVYFNAGATVPTDAQICVRLVQADGTTATQAIGSNCGSAPSLPSGMATGSCAVAGVDATTGADRPGRRAEPDFDIGAKSVAYYGREVPPTCTAS